MLSGMQSNSEWGPFAFYCVALLRDPQTNKHNVNVARKQHINDNDYDDDDDDDDDDYDDDDNDEYLFLVISNL